jgi:hypothetical protein
MSDSSLQCWNCGGTLADLPLPLSRHANCPACFEELHCCRMCQHYRPKATIACAEERADSPVRKEAANFCDWFAFSAAVGASVPPDSAAHDARAKLDALFDDTATRAGADDPNAASARTDDPRARLEALFGSGSETSKGRPT